MKKSNHTQEYINNSVDELEQKVSALRRELFGLQLNSSTAHVKDYSKFKKFRKQIACALTFLNMKKKKA